MDACTELLQNEADITAVDKSGKSALFYAALNLREDVCKLMEVEELQVYELLNQPTYSTSTILCQQLF